MRPRRHKRVLCVTEVPLGHATALIAGADCPRCIVWTTLHSVRRQQTQSAVNSARLDTNTSKQTTAPRSNAASDDAATAMTAALVGTNACNGTCTVLRNASTPSALCNWPTDTRAANEEGRTLLHGEALLVLAAHDLEDVAFELLHTIVLCLRMRSCLQLLCAVYAVSGHGP